MKRSWSWFDGMSMEKKLAGVTARRADLAKADGI
jgi:hypothetical protein